MKFLITIFAVVVLLIHLQPISLPADAAAQPVVLGAHLRPTQIQLVVAPAAALLVFIVNTTLAVYKPQGRTRYGQRKQQEHSVGSQP